MAPRDILIQNTLKIISKLPSEKIREVSDFADYIMKKHDEEILKNGIEKLISDSKAFDFLKTEEDLYSLEDLKERF